MVKSPTKPLILEEFLKLPETKLSSEYINGQIIQKPMPQGKHSTLWGKLLSLTSLELRCTFGRRSIVPDVVVFAWEWIPMDFVNLRKTELEPQNSEFEPQNSKCQVLHSNPELLSSNFQPFRHNCRWIFSTIDAYA